MRNTQTNRKPCINTGDLRKKENGFTCIAVPLQMIIWIGNQQNMCASVLSSSSQDQWMGTLSIECAKLICICVTKSLGSRNIHPHLSVSCSTLQLGLIRRKQLATDSWWLVVIVLSFWSLILTLKVLTLSHNFAMLKPGNSKIFFCNITHSAS